LREILAQEPGVTAVLDARQLAQLFEARNYLGATEAFIARVLAAHPARGQ
jgi:adenylosuccinate lyase